MLAINQYAKRAQTSRIFRIYQSLRSYFCTGLCSQSISTPNVLKLLLYFALPNTPSSRYSLLSAQCYAKRAQTSRIFRVYQSLRSYFRTRSCSQSIRTQNALKLLVYFVFPITLQTRYNLLSGQCCTKLSCNLEIISVTSLIF